MVQVARENTLFPEEEKMLHPSVVFLPIVPRQVPIYCTRRKRERHSDAASEIKMLSAHAGYILKL